MRIVILCTAAEGVGQGGSLVTPPEELMSRRVVSRIANDAEYFHQRDCNLLKVFVPSGKEEYCLDII
jgi:hypothetical protein